MKKSDQIGEISNEMYNSLHECPTDQYFVVKALSRTVEALAVLSQQLEEYESKRTEKSSTRDDAELYKICVNHRRRTSIIISICDFYRERGFISSKQRAVLARFVEEFGVQNDDAEPEEQQLVSM